MHDFVCCEPVSAHACACEHVSMCVHVRAYVGVLCVASVDDKAKSVYVACIKGICGACPPNVEKIGVFYRKVCNSNLIKSWSKSLSEQKKNKKKKKKNI